MLAGVGNTPRPLTQAALLLGELACIGLAHRRFGTSFRQLQTVEWATQPTSSCRPQAYPLKLGVVAVKSLNKTIICSLADPLATRSVARVPHLRFHRVIRGRPWLSPGSFF